MIRRAIEWGVSKEWLGRVFSVNLSSLNQRTNLREGISPCCKTSMLPCRHAHPTQHEVLSPGGGSGVDDCQKDLHRVACRGPAQDHTARAAHLSKVR